MKNFALVALVAVLGFTAGSAVRAIGTAEAATPKARAISHVSSETFESTSTVTFAGPVIMDTANTTVFGSVTLASASPSTATATVRAGSKCFCTNQTTAANGVKCVVSSTTLTVTGPNTVTDVINYLCL